MTVTPPTVRQDLEIEEDYVEEVARMFGYDNLPVSLPSGGQAAKLTKAEELRAKTRDILTGYGMNEILTYSFVSPKSVDKAGISENDISKRNFVKIINPLGEENSVMRTMLTPNMMEVLSKNYAKGNKAVKLFEIGRIFNNVKINCDGQPAEAEGLSMGIYGEEADFFEIKGIINGLLDSLGIDDVVYEAEEGLGMYHPGRCANIISNGELLGTVGEMHPDVAERYGISERVYTCELLFSAIMGQSETDIIYTPLPKYPAVTRDIALLVDEDITVGSIMDIISEKGGKLLENAELFDVYRGKQIESGKKSVAFALTYRDAGKTLTDDEVAKVHNNILAGLEKEVNAVLREV
jgi:phenylalanyl-tRNA synthetase beta chain